MDDLDAGLFGIAHRLTHFFQRLLFFEPIQHLLAAALNAEHDGPAMGLGHRREEPVSLQGARKTAGRERGSEKLANRLLVSLNEDSTALMHGEGGSYPQESM